MPNCTNCGKFYNFWSDSGQSLYGINDTDSTPESVESNGIGQDGTQPGDAYSSVAPGTTYTAPGNASVASDD